MPSWSWRSEQMCGWPQAQRAKSPDLGPVSADQGGDPWGVDELNFILPMLMRFAARAPIV